MPLKKIDNTGRYLRFPGITIIANILDSDMDLWHSIYQLLIKHPDFCNYFTPLPVDSYHMTCINLNTHQEIGSANWTAFLGEKRTFFQAIKKTLRESTFSPIIKIESLTINGVLQILVSLPKEQVQRIHEMARNYHLETKVPDVFHITLAYQFKPLDTATLNAIKQSLKEDISSLLSTHTAPLCLTPPTLSSFESMTHFTTWDPDTIPALETSADTPNFFSKQAPKQEKPISQCCNIM